MTPDQLPRPVTGVSGVTNEERPTPCQGSAFVVTKQPGGFPHDSRAPAVSDSHESRPNINSYFRMGAQHGLGECLPPREVWPPRIRQRPFPVDPPFRLS